MNAGCLASRLKALGIAPQAHAQLLETLERHPRRVPAGTVLQEPGATPVSPMLLRDGWAVLRSDPHRGRKAILRIYLAGDFMAWPDGLLPEARHRIEMRTAGTVCPVDRAALEDIFTAAPDLGRALFQLCQFEELAERERISALIALPAEQRLISFLLVLCDRIAAFGAGRTRRIHMPLSQAEIGEVIGLSAVSVNRCLGRLSETGLIAVDRPHISLLDRAALERRVDYRSPYRSLAEGRAPGSPTSSPEPTARSSQPRSFSNRSNPSRTPSA